MDQRSEYINNVWSWSWTAQSTSCTLYFEETHPLPIQEYCTKYQAALSTLAGGQASSTIANENTKTRELSNNWGRQRCRGYGSTGCGEESRQKAGKSRNIVRI